MMIIKETIILTKKILTWLPDEDYSLLQEELVKNPEVGKGIKNRGGIRKVRWGLRLKGKRGGLRVIYIIG